MCKVEVSWNFWNFWRLQQSDLLQSWSRLTEISSVSINFKSRCILYDIYSVHVFTIIHMDTFHGGKGDFRVTCPVTSFKIRNHYIVVDLTVVVYWVEDYCASRTKLWVSKKVVLFIILPEHIYIYIYIYIYIFNR